MPGFGHLFLTALFTDVFYRNIMVSGNKFHGGTEGKVFLFHYKRNGITATVTTETVEEILAWGNGKGTGLFGMKRTKSH
ncbi:hypothetical protein CE91St11_23260 [Bacteroides uniformis]|nr:hypothetical protein CE91St10_23260 [Bacteroides uniformis]GKH29152.1 hypothetical protein CE91St11_23260 [Bacteroides uniformis]